MFNYPQKTVTHETLTLLQGRKKLTPTEDATLKRLESGYDGEVRFAQLLHQNLPTSKASFFSINLELSGSESQFDCIHMARQKLYHFEIKNYQEDFYMDGEKWFHRSSKKEIRNPLHQLNRSDILLKEYLSTQSLSLSVESFVIFIHPTFHLYQSRMQNPIIYYSQLQRLMKHLQTLPAPQTQQLQQMKRSLAKAHRDVSKYDHKPTYDYHSLKKGVYCRTCYGTLNHLNNKQCYCKKCELAEDIQETLLRHIHTFQFLFPDNVLSVGVIFDWCDGVFSKKQIRRILSNYFTLIKQGRSSFYIE